MKQGWADWEHLALGRVLRGMRGVVAKLGRLAVWLARGTHRVVRELEPYSLVFAALSVLAVSATMAVDLSDRQSERTFRAWQVVRGYVPQVVESNADGSVGTSSSSLREAVEYLNRDFDGFLCAAWLKPVFATVTGDLRRTCFFPRKVKESLAGLLAPVTEIGNVFLPRADLEGAELYLSNLAGACLLRTDLDMADLRTTDLMDADLSGATLNNASLSAYGSFPLGADLSRADLSDAILKDADWDHAILVDTDLTRADLRGAKNLLQVQFAEACGQRSPRNIPSHLSWSSRPCPDKVMHGDCS